MLIISKGYRRTTVTREEVAEALYEADFDPPVYGLTRDQAKQAATAIMALLKE